MEFEGSLGGKGEKRCNSVGKRKVAMGAEKD